MPTLDRSPARWRDALRAVESAGYATVAVSDHVTRGWSMDPIVAMAAAADATSHLRVLSLVLANDFRNPALVHRAMATLDVLSGGRVEVGLGAGWLADDYAALGLAMDPVGARLDRLEEAIELLRRLFESAEPVTMTGRHVRTEGLSGLPRPVQRPRPPILVGGGGRRVLSIAGARADIVGVNAALTGGAGRPAAIAGLTAAAAAEKVAWVKLGVAQAARRSDPELQVSVLDLHLTPSTRARNRWLASIGDACGLDAESVDASPAVLVGSIDRCVQLLEERRAAYGFSYVKLGSDPTAAAPVVARLAGR